MRHWPSLFKNAPRIACALALGCFALLAQLQPVEAQEGRRVMFVLDASNSMWAQIGDTNKIVTARRAIAKSYGDHGKSLQIGVLAYGSRQEKSCSDIVTVVPLGTAEMVTADDKLKRLRPKGATPLAQAITKAAQEAAFTEHPTTIIVIADGPDNCGKDPCAVARSLNEQSAKLRIDVIGFDKDTDKLAQLACMAQATGGTFSTANTIDTLNNAVANVTLASLEASPSATANSAQPVTPETIATGVPVAKPSIMLPPIPTPAARGGTPPAQSQAEEAVRAAAAAAGLPTAEGTPAPQLRRERLPLRLMALITEDTAPIETGLVWRVFTPEPGPTGDHDLVAQSDDAQPVFVLDPGTYIVHATFGLAGASRRIAIADAAVEDTMVLNAGGLKLRAIGGDELELESHDVEFSVYSSEQDEYGQRKLVVPNAQAGTIIRLGAGAYHVVSQFGDANSTIRSDLQIKPGKLTQATIRHDAAAITLKLVNEAGGEALANTAWSVLSPGGDVIKESYGAFPTHVLSAGEYTVIARHEGQLYNKDFSVEAGRTKEVELVAR